MKFVQRFQKNGKNIKNIRTKKLFALYALADFARHLTELEKRKQITEFEDVFQLIERFHFGGDDYVQNAVVVGLLESLKLNHGIDGEIFVKYLHPESLKWWSEIGQFRSGKIKYIEQPMM